MLPEIQKNIYNNPEKRLKKAYFKKGKFILSVICISTAISFILSGCTLLNLLPGPEQGTKTSADELIQINSYDVNIVVNENNTYKINESITAVLNNAHGIRRDISLNVQIPHNIDGKEEVKLYPIVISGVKSDEQFKTETTNGIYTIFLGDPKKTVSGEQKYNFSYTYDAGDDGYQQFDELYNNIIDTGWSVPIDNVTFSIIMPENFDPSKINILLGKQGISGDKNVVFAVKGKTISGKITRKVLPGEKLSINIKLPNLYFTERVSRITEKPTQESEEEIVSSNEIIQGTPGSAFERKNFVFKFISSEIVKKNIEGDLQPATEFLKMLVEITNKSSKSARPMDLVCIRAYQNKLPRGNGTTGGYYDEDYAKSLEWIEPGATVRMAYCFPLKGTDDLQVRAINMASVNFASVADEEQDAMVFTFKLK